jgi:hypothetical protein
VVGKKMEGDVVVAQIIEIGIELSARIGVKIEPRLQQFHQFKENPLHVGGQREMAEAIVVKVKKAEGTAGFQHRIEVPDDFKTLDPVVLEDETNPDQVKQAHGIKGMAEVMEAELYAGWVFVVLLRVLDSFFRIIDTHDPAAGFEHLPQNRRDFAGSASRVQDMHSRTHTAPNRLTSNGLRIGFEFKTERLF